MPVEQVTTLQIAKVDITPTQYTKVNIKRLGTTVPEVIGVYPFRVRFKDLGYPGFSTNTTPGIGIAVIGSTFYIL
jgi:hypothetical protein